MQQIDSKFFVMRDSAAYFNAQISQADAYRMNNKLVQSWYLESFNNADSIFAPSETTRLLIADMACQDPWVAGDAVYQARAIMGWLKPCDSDNNFGFKNGEIENENGTGETDILVYPNPSQDAFTIDFPFAEVIEIEILDINGKVIQKIAIRETNSFRFEHTLKTGIYLLQITLDQQQPYTQKISVE